MKIAKPYKWSLLLFLVIAAGVLFFFFRMYHDDMRALKAFMASYEMFDRAISDLSMTGTDDSVGKAGKAAADLDAKASLRLSSLIKNDAGLMVQARKVADLARQEIDSLMVARVEAQKKNTDLDKLAEESRVLTGKRKTAYARFQELGGSR